MKARLSVQLSLTLLSDVIEEFVSTIGATLTGKALVPIFGVGDEEDNWEALHSFLSSQDGRRVGTKANLLLLLHQRIQIHVEFMCKPVTQEEAKRSSQVAYEKGNLDARRACSDIDGSPAADIPPCGYASHSECQALAMAIVFLSEHIVRQEKARWIGKSEGLAMMDHLRGWSRKALYEHCLAQLQKRNLQFHHTPSELLPGLANSFYLKSLVPWMLRGIAPQGC